MSRMGCAICCAVGMASSVGAPMPGSGPRFAVGFSAPGLVVFWFGAAGLGLGAVGLDGSAQGLDAGLMAGFGATKSRTVGANSGLACVQVDTSACVIGSACGYGRPS